MHVLASWESHLVLLDECSHILVADNSTFPFLNAEYVIWNDDLGILLDLRLAGKTILSLDLLTVEEANFGREDVARTFFDDTLTLTALTATTAGT